MSKLTSSKTSADARLRWQCRRGMLELDELLQNYLDRHYASVDASEQGVFRTLLTFNDQELFDFFFGALAPADPQLQHVIERIRRAVSA